MAGSFRQHHPAFDNMLLADDRIYKNRRPTVEQNKEQQHLKKLKKKRRKGR
ncbi:TPA: hypothetical protein VPG52_000618 [Streptococcus pyogenes]|uniref:Uncharacterized protein n=1 Tax=Streptococcus equi subsp. zooepidemicus TaxID=40041 RepID=A0AAX2LJA5_STRSZ|nr:hypothetical protein [Streptococcus dysgalactiae]SQE96488.1 Uncharacterised protein [Streptococcus equi subsp. zooepidemicus]HER9932117.1 hypothetical protein [Streptococcus pyogenes]SUO81754.1 Uncharacterised protein [Streptococcus equi subsp. zooepidemicus]HES7110848.1 hypothetical protein [Streptococcus pyogenes]